jgi:hypothetical protein
MILVKKISTLIYTAMIGLLFAACGGNDAQQSAGPDISNDVPVIELAASRSDEKIPRRIVVFCDLSASLQQQEIDQLKQCGAYLLEKMPPNSSISYVQIGQTIQPAFFKHEKPRIKGKNADLLRLGIDKKAKEAIPQLHGEIDRLFQANRNDPKHGKTLNSCILNTFFHADQVFAAQAGASQDIMILITDMIEQCENSPVGKLNMRVTNKSELESKFNNLEQIASNKYKGGYKNLGNAQPVIIRLSRQIENNQIALQQERFSDLWKSFFLQAGFSPESLQNWHFLPECEISIFP